MRIILFRHGENDGDCLTSQGRRNVKNIGKQLKAFSIQKIYSSSANRCLQTSEILAKILKIDEIIVKNELKERFQLNHLPKNESEQRWWDNYMNAKYSEPANDRVGETFSEFLSRNKKVFDELIKTSNPNEDILIVAHSATSYALTGYIYKTDKINWMKIGNANYIVFEI